jgi:hypothetical protein
MKPEDRNKYETGVNKVSGTYAKCAKLRKAYAVIDNPYSMKLERREAEKVVREILAEDAEQ